MSSLPAQLGSIVAGEVGARDIAVGDLSYQRLRKRQAHRL